MNAHPRVRIHERAGEPIDDLGVGAGDRNGQKSIAQFINVEFVEEAAEVYERLGTDVMWVAT